MTARYLGDSSVTARLDQPSVRKRFMPLAEAGLVATCAALDIEVGRTARSQQDWRDIIEERELLYPWMPEPDGVVDDALTTHRALAKVGQQRGIGIPDLIIAATAVFHKLIVLHYDHDFELIAAVTGQPVEWVVPRGSVQ